MKVTKIPIILTTSDEDIKCQFTKDKKFQIFEDLLIKPISVEQMYNKINCVVQRAKQKLWEYT